MANQLVMPSDIDIEELLRSTDCHANLEAVARVRDTFEIICLDTNDERGRPAFELSKKGSKRLRTSICKLLDVIQDERVNWSERGLAELRRQLEWCNGSGYEEFVTGKASRIERWKFARFALLYGDWLALRIDQDHQLHAKFSASGKRKTDFLQRALNMAGVMAEPDTIVSWAKKVESDRTSIQF